MNNVAECAELELVCVHDSKWRTYAHRVEVPAVVSCDGLFSPASLIETVLNLVRSKGSIHRIIIPVSAEVLGRHEGTYLQALVRATSFERSRILLQVEGCDYRSAPALADFCNFAERRVGLGVILRAEDCEADVLDSLICSSGASIVSLGKGATRRAHERGNSIEILDAIEVATQYGACLMMEGLDAQSDVERAFGAGAMLGIGKILSRPIAIQARNFRRTQLLPAPLLADLAYAA